MQLVKDNVYSCFTVALCIAGSRGASRQNAQNAGDISVCLRKGNLCRLSHAECHFDVRESTLVEPLVWLKMLSFSSGLSKSCHLHHPWDGHPNGLDTCVTRQTF